MIIQLFHPNLAESRVNATWAKAARAAGFEIRDLYGLYPDQKIDLATEQAILKQHDLVVFQHPLYWYAAPSLFKQWMEDVLTFGFAYGEPNEMQGKRWQSAITVGGHEVEYRRGGSREYTLTEFLRPLERTAAFCGMSWLGPYAVFSAGYMEAGAIEDSAADYANFLRTLN